MSNAFNPLPSLIRASAWDAGNIRMRKACRTKWDRDDYNRAAETQNRLVRACYGYKTDAPDSPMCFIRFSVAEQMERAGMFHVDSGMPEIHRAIDHALSVVEAA